MESKGFALYKKGDTLYIVRVAYEYPETRFVGLSDTEIYRIHKTTEEQKTFQQKNPTHPKLSNISFVGDFYYIRTSPFTEFPKGKPYTQLPGGGGVFKETRKCHKVKDMFTNPTVLRAFDKYATFKKKKNIREQIRRIVSEEVLKQQYVDVSFTAVSIEDEKHIKKIDKVFDFLKKKGGVIPDDFIRPSYPNGKRDYHMTIVLGELPTRFMGDVNKSVSLNITSVGVSDLAVALGVSGDYFSENENQHITLAFKDFPKDSKHIEKWIKLKIPFVVKGAIREFSSDKEIIKRGVFRADEANQIEIGNFQASAVASGKSAIFPYEEEQVLNEYISSDMISLKRYFLMSDDEKKTHLPHEYHYFFEDFLVETGTDFTTPKETVLSNYVDEPEEEIDMFDNDIELIIWLENNNKDVYDKFADWLFKKIEDHELPIADAEFPAWSYFDFPELVKNQWLIHFTNNAGDIAKEGFKYGVDEVDKLGLTTNLGEFDKKYGGYNFSYLLSDFVKYSKSDYTRGGGYKYGKEAVIFNASGIKLWHHGDGEPQVIFYGNTAKNIIPILYRVGDLDFGVYDKKTGGKLYENDELENVVNWLTRNYVQYKKRLHF